MKPIHFKLAATGLLAVCLLLVAQRSGRKAEITERDAAPHRREFPGTSLRGRNHDLTAISQRRSGSKLPAGPPSPHVADGNSASRQSTRVPATTVSTDPGLADTPLETSGSATPVNSQGRGIQLAANVQLPAAIMAMGRRELNASGRIPTPADEAAREIANTFYQDLAATAGEPPDNPPEADATTVIAPGQEVEAARARANEIYRTLFGDAAYNRQSMDSAIEVRLPEDSTAGQP